MTTPIPAGGADSLPPRIDVCEVGPRDGLQNHPVIYPVEARVRLVDALVEAGARYVEAAAFVREDRVPAMAGAAEVFRGIERRPGVRYAALVPNLRGLERALTAGVDAVVTWASATDSFAQSNTGRTVESELSGVLDVVREAREAGTWIRGFVSVAFGCPFEGAVSPETVYRVASALLDSGVDRLALGDTIGVATPRDVDLVLDRLSAVIDPSKIELHFHDTRKTALANVFRALQWGVTTFDSSVAGLGGCPFAPGASGNLGTEELLYLARGLGIETGMDAAKVRVAGQDLVVPRV